MRAAVGKVPGDRFRGMKKDVMMESARCLGRCQDSRVGDWVVVPFSEWESKRRNAIW